MAIIICHSHAGHAAFASDLVCQNLDRLILYRLSFSGWRCFLGGTRWNPTSGTRSEKVWEPLIFMDNAKEYWISFKSVKRLDGARGKKQTWRPRVRTWGLSEANVLHWSTCDIVRTFRRPLQSMDESILRYVRALLPLTLRYFTIFIIQK